MVRFRRGDNLLGSRFRKKLNQLGQLVGMGGGPLNIWHQPQARLVTLPSGGTWSTGTTDGITDDVTSATCKQVLWHNTDHASTPNDYVASNIDVKVYNEAGLTEPAVGDVFWALWNRQSGRWCLVASRVVDVGTACDCEPCATLGEADVTYAFYILVENLEFTYPDPSAFNDCCSGWNADGNMSLGSACNGTDNCTWVKSEGASCYTSGGPTSWNLTIQSSGSDYYWRLRAQDFDSGSNLQVLAEYRSDLIASGSFDCAPAGITLNLDSGGECWHNENQSVDITGSPTGGTYKLAFDGQVTAAITYNVNPESALEALSNIDDVVVSGIYPNWTVEFDGAAIEKTDQPLITLDTNSLTGGTSPSVSISEDRPGGTHNWPSSITLTGVAPP